MDTEPGREALAKMEVRVTCFDPSRVARSKIGYDTAAILFWPKYFTHICNGMADGIGL